jgi:OmpA-OmpF porin, OOP family
MRYFLAALLSVSYFVVLPAVAQENGFYLGAKAGQSKFRGGCEPTPGITFTSCDDKETAWGVFAGYQFNRYIALETGWTDLGEITAVGNVGGTPFSAGISAKGWEFVGVGSIPFSQQVSAYAKAGAYRWRVRGTVAVPGLGTASASDSGTDFTYGVGLRFDFTKNVGARLEWQRYNDVGTATTGEGDLNLWSLGVLVKF